MMDPYALLEIAPDADPATIKQAYRRLAKKLHPDRNLGDIKREQQFKAVTEAYHLLSNEKTRRDFDRGRIDGSGQPRKQSNGQASAFKWDGSTFGHAVGPALDRVIAKIGKVVRHSDLRPPFKRKAKAKAPPDRGQEAASEHGLDVDFVTAVLGGRQQMTMPDSTRLDVSIPPGTKDKVILRLRPPHSPAEDGRARGDLLVRVRVLDHPLFTRRGQDLFLDLPLSLREALQGGRIKTPTIEGPVWLTIPEAANSGQLLRLKGKGVPDHTGKRGDQYVRLMVMLPKEPDAVMAAYLQHLADYTDYDVRDHFESD